VRPRRGVAQDPHAAEVSTPLRPPPPRLSGYVTAEDRGLLLNLIRGPARVAAIDAPGLNPIALALSGQAFTASPQTESFLARQVASLTPAYRKLLQAYVAGINAYFKHAGIPVDPYTTNDVVAAAALIAARFGANGGQEADKRAVPGGASRPSSA